MTERKVVTKQMTRRYAKVSKDIRSGPTAAS